jgi:hypothetical protein
VKLTGAIVSHDPRDHDFHSSDAYAGAVPQPIRDYDFRHLHTWRIQLAPSCVAVSMNSKAQALAKAQGKPLPLLSYNFSWTYARMAAQPPVGGQPLPVVGSNGHLNMKGARDRGFKAESVFPDVPSNHARVYPADALAAEPVAKLGRWSAIKGEGKAALLRDGILNAFRLLDAGGQCSFPGAVIEVGSGFANVPEGETWNGDLGETWGNHDQAIVQYRERDDSVGFASSWGGERIFWMPVPLLAARGTWFSVIESLIYPVKI